jgi:hypothetical protein
VGLVTVLASRLGVLLCARRVLLPLRVIAFAMMFGGSAVGFGGILVMFGCLVVFVFGHDFLRRVWRGTLAKLWETDFGSKVCLDPNHLFCCQVIESIRMRHVR